MKVWFYSNIINEMIPVFMSKFFIFLSLNCIYKSCWVCCRLNNAMRHYADNNADIGAVVSLPLYRETQFSCQNLLTAYSKKWTSLKNPFRYIHLNNSGVWQFRLTFQLSVAVNIIHKSYCVYCILIMSLQILI